ncbi:peptidyl-prolyl cis-trans isomerase [Actinomadura rubrobrunea]|uniref:Peptidyl-prolyl cis-trans isomerase n=1 Tax=Actinomadura rubrobrunea TaxID=115335 RepID=A0A9W6PZE7_9ACTN|nr:peptidylprolyl isomerase [Actinomadura rubrobrunea]GLW67005.1 peptidyl-prolyl cis-trans isomerase [Actinomadura rubrobrunea]
MAGKDRKKQLARQRYERQQQRRRAQEARARRVKIIGSVLAVAVVAGGVTGVVALVGGDDDSKADAAASPQASPSAQASSAKPGECAYNDTGDAAKDVGKPPAKPAYDKAVKATLKTNQGEVELELDGKKAPCTVNSFAYLAKKDYFDKTECHRLTSGGLSVLQCGDPKGDGTGGPGYQFADENTQGAEYDKGTLAMANSGPDTNGSQFFMVYADSQLPPNYSVFGKITSGMDVLEKIAKGGSEPEGDGKPKTKVTIQDVSIAKK